VKACSKWRFWFVTRSASSGSRCVSIMTELKLLLCLLFCAIICRSWWLSYSTNVTHIKPMFVIYSWRDIKHEFLMKWENQRTKSIALCSGMLICELVHVPIALRLKDWHPAFTRGDSCLWASAIVTIALRWEFECNYSKFGIGNYFITYSLFIPDTNTQLARLQVWGT